MSRPRTIGWPKKTTVLTAAAAIVAAGTAHTKGNWSDLITAANVTEDAVGFWFQVTTAVGQSGTNTGTLIDIGLGNTGNAVDRIAVSNLYVGAWDAFSKVWLPIRIPSGTRVAARSQSAVTSKSITPILTLCFGGRTPEWNGFSYGETLAVDTATSGTTFGDLTDNAWEEIVSSTSLSYRALSMAAGLTTSNSLANAAFTVDLGIGASTQERVIGSIRVESFSTETLLTQQPWYVEGNFGPGFRIAGRKNDTNEVSAGVIGWV